MKRNVGPKIEAETHEFLGDQFITVNRGATYLLDSMPHLMRQAFRSARDQLADNELGAIVDYMKRSQLPPPSFAGDRVVKVCEELGTMDHFGIQPGALRATLSSMTQFERAVLEIWAVNANRKEMEALK